MFTVTGPPQVPNTYDDTLLAAALQIFKMRFEVSPADVQSSSSVFDAASAFLIAELTAALA
jgi:hypothetical protein